MDISQLRANPKNPRTISAEKLAMLKRSLEEFGDLSGVVYNQKSQQLVGGHQRIQSLDKKSKITLTKKYVKPTKTGTVAEGFIESGGERFAYREVKWSSSKEKAANIAANKGAGEWDTAQLGEWMRELGSEFDFNLDLTMFDEEERAEFFQEEMKEEENENVVPPVSSKAKTKPGDLYILGEHRLYCGDSTNEAHLSKLFKDERNAFCFTSPPYNLGDNAKLRGHLASGKDSAYNEKSDHKSQKEYLDFLIDFTNAALYNCEVAFINIQLLAGNKLIFCDYWKQFAKHLVDVIVWDKEHGAPAMAENVLNSAFEFIFIFSKHENATRAIQTAPTFRGKFSNIYRLNPKREKKEEIQKEHGAVFPVAFPEYFIKTFSKSKYAIYDPFGGSGTTLIAAEKQKRKCFMMEIDPKYCDVIVQRWQDFTGKKATLVAQARHKHA